MRFFERSYPYLFGVLAACVYAWYSFPFPKGEEILSSSITVAAIFTGFLATTKSLVISIESAPMKELRKTRFLNLLVSYLREAIYSSLFMGLVGMLGFFQDAHNQPKWYGIMWTGSLVITLLTFTRVTNSLLKIIEMRKD